MITTALKSYSYIIVALSSILGSIIVAPYISKLGGVTSPDPAPLIPAASAITLPFEVDHHVKIKEKVGDTVTLEEWNNDADRNCEMSCTYVRYQSGSMGKAGLAYVTDSPVDLSGAKKVHFFLMGEKGGEMVKVKIAGKSPTKGLVADAPFKEKFSIVSNVITLSNDWKRYEISLDGINLKGVNSPFAIEILKGKTSANQGVYFKFVVFENEMVDQRFVLSTNATINSTALTLNNSTVPSSDAVETINGTTGQIAENTGDNNTTNNKRSADTRRIDRANSNTNVETRRSAPTNNASADIPEEQTRNPADITTPQQNDKPNSPPVATVSVDNIVAHPNDKVVLNGTLSSDPDGDRITYSWSQSGGPNVDIIGGDTATPAITIPNLDDGDKVTIDLEVSDSHGASDRATVIINIQNIQEPTPSKESSTSRSSAPDEDSKAQDEQEPTPTSSPEPDDVSAPEGSGVSNARDNTIDDDDNASLKDSTPEESSVTNDNSRSGN